MTQSRRKPREFYMDTDLLDMAINSCDLGDGYMAKVRMFPHKDHIKYYTKVREVSHDYDKAVERMVEALNYYKDSEFGQLAREALAEFERVNGK